jgi:hypothetical protein
MKALPRSASDPMFQRQPVQKLHCDERFAVLIVYFVDRADVGMIERRSSPGFALKAAQGLRIFGQLIRQEFEGNKSTEFHVLGLVDNTHAATAQLLDDAVVRDGLLDHLHECYDVRMGISMHGLCRSLAYSALARFRMGMSLQCIDTSHA